MTKIDQPSFDDALEAHLSGDLEGAMIICEGLLGENEEKAAPEVQHLLGECLLEMQEPEEALRFFDLALAQLPDEGVLMLGRGVALFELHDFPGAEQALKGAASADPELGEPLFYLGLLAEFEGDQAGADRFFQSAVNLAPEDLALPSDWSEETIRAAFDAMIEECPDPVATWLAGLPLAVRDLPTPEELVTQDGPVSPLRHCRLAGEPGDGPFGEDPAGWLDTMPEQVVLYRRNLGKTAHDEYELHREIFEAVLWEMMDFLCLEDEHMVRLGVLEDDAE